MGSISGKTRVAPPQVSNDDETFLFAMHLACAAELPMVLKTALKLDLLEIMAKAGPSGSLSPREIASQLSTKNPDAHTMLDWILRLLATHSIVTCTMHKLPDGRAEGLYGMAPVCKFLTKNEDGVSVVPFLLMNHDKASMERWYHLKDAVLEGGVPFNKVYGMTPFDYFGTNPRLNKPFNEAMFGISTITMKKVLETYKGFEGLKSVVDLGGGTGAVLSMIVSKYPSVKGINFDLPHVIANSASYPGVEHVGGDMFVNVPTGDAIFMKSICHDWSDEYCLKFLKNCYNAQPEDGKVIVAEYILPELPDTSFAANLTFHSDLIMMAYPGRKEQTEKEFEALAKAAGFKGFRVACIFYDHIMEFLKN